MGDRQAGADDFHADRDQVRLIESAVPKGDRLQLLKPELNVSGGLPLEQRPSLLQAVEGIERGEFAGVIVGYLSRLGRNVKEQLITYDRVHAAGGRIIVAQEGIDARTRGGRLQRNILAAIHEDEREQHVERFENLREWATTAGIWQRRQTPRGYSKDPETRRLVPDERASQVVRAFEARRSGSAMSAIARDLGMTPSGARALLRNRVYLGELRVGQHVNGRAHEPLIEEDLFLAVQGARVVRGPIKAGEIALLAGMVRCCGCGHVMSPTRTAAPVYGCHVNHSAGRCPEPASITMRLLDEHVAAAAARELSVLAARPSHSDDRVQTARVALQDAQRELEAFLEAVSAADLGPSEFAAAARRRRDDVAAARDELQRALAERAVPLPSDPAADWLVMDGTQRNRLLRRLFEVVLVKRAGGRGRNMPIADRVRVVRQGAGLSPGEYRGGGQAVPLTRIELPHLDDVDVARP